jgi:hypothetical protein
VILIGIVICEVAFWAFLGAGLVVRYGFRRPRLSRYLLLGSPAADLALLVLAAVDLARGARATEAHSLAAAYLAFTVVFGPGLVRWADARFAHRFVAGAAPSRRPARGRERMRHEWREFAKAVAACALTSGLLGLGVLLVNDAERSRPLIGFEVNLGLVLVIWFAVGPLWDTISFAASPGDRRRPAGRSERPPARR